MATASPPQPTQAPCGTSLSTQRTGQSVIGYLPHKRQTPRINHPQHLLLEGEMPAAAAPQVKRRRPFPHYNAEEPGVLALLPPTWSLPQCPGVESSSSPAAVPLRRGVTTLPTVPKHLLQAHTAPPRLPYPSRRHAPPACGRAQARPGRLCVFDKNVRSDASAASCLSDIRGILTSNRVPCPRTDWRAMCPPQDWRI